jgi:hypothetical protein
MLGVGVVGAGVFPDGVFGDGVFDDGLELGELAAPELLVAAGLA